WTPLSVPRRRRSGISIGVNSPVRFRGFSWDLAGDSSVPRHDRYGIWHKHNANGGTAMTGNNRGEGKGWPGNAKAWLGNAKTRAFRSPVEKNAPNAKPADDRLIEATVISDPRHSRAAEREHTT